MPALPCCPASDCCGQRRSLPPAQPEGVREQRCRRGGMSGHLRGREGSRLPLGPCPCALHTVSMVSAQTGQLAGPGVVVSMSAARLAVPLGGCKMDV